MAILPDDPFKQGQVKDLMADDHAAEEARAARDAERELEELALQETARRMRKPGGDLTGTDDTFIGTKDLDFLNRNKI